MITLNDYSLWLFKTFVHRQPDYDIFRLRIRDGVEERYPFSWTFYEEEAHKVIISTVTGGDDPPEFNTFEYQQYLIQHPVITKSTFFILHLWTVQKPNHFTIEAYIDDPLNTMIALFPFEGDIFNEFMRFKLALA